MNHSQLTTTVDDEQQPSMAVIDLVSRVNGVDPLDLEPLYDAIDPDVLNALCNPDSGFDRLEFSYHGHSITVADVDGDLEISLDPQDAVEFRFENSNDIIDSEHSA